MAKRAGDARQKTGCPRPVRRTGRPGLGEVLLSRGVGVTAGGVTLLILLGCMSFSLGGKTYTREVHECHSEDGLLVQEGEAHVKGRCEIDVYYPLPYGQPPNLEMSEESDEYVLVDQKPDHFRVRNPSCFRGKVCWRARGVRSLPGGPVPAGPPVSPTPLPPEPIPVAGPASKR